MTTYRYLPPEQAVPIILDRARSPVVAWDTEFDADVTGLPPCRAGLTGLSIAGGNPKDGFVGTFWHFGNAAETWPWALLLERVLLPLFGDPDRILAAHPLKVDLQPIRARGVTAELTRAKLHCTFSQCHIWNENLPKGLKALAQALLGVHGLKGYKAVRSEIAGIRKEGAKVVKEILKAAWEYYRAFRATTKSGRPVAARWIEHNGTVTTWGQASKAVKEAGGKLKPEDVTLLDYTGQRTGWHGLVDRLETNGVKKAELTEWLKRKVEPVVTEDFERRANDRFTIYGTEDALYCLGLYYYFLANPPEEYEDPYPALDLEMTICHPVCTEMEEEGLPMDLELLRAIRERLEEAEETLRQQVVAMWGVANGLPDFNPNSDDQKAHILWEVWKLRPPKWCFQRGSGGQLKPQWIRSKDGLPKTSKDIMASLVTAGGRRTEALKRMQEYDRVSTLLTYPVRPMEERVANDPQQRLHSQFWGVGAGTGRFSSSDPNVENVPRGSTMPYILIPKGADPTQPPRGATIVKLKDSDQLDLKRWQVESLRHTFIAPDGWVIVAVDLSQVENRVVAVESRDATLLSIFRGWDCADCGASGEVHKAIHACPNCGAPDGKRDKTQAAQPAIKGFCLSRDIHAHTAVAGSGTPSFVDRWGFAKGRQSAKALNHAASYGMGPDTMAKQHDMDRKVCKVALEAWHARHPGVKANLLAEVTRDIRERGYIRLFNGHVRRFHVEKLLMDSGNFNKWEWEGVLREGVNCFSGDTRFFAGNRLVRLDEMVGKQVWVRGLDGGTHLADVRSYGRRQVYAVTLKPLMKGRSNLRRTFRATRDHRWVVLKDGRRVVTTNLQAGDRIPGQQAPTFSFDADGYAHGFVFGDGSREQRKPRKHTLRLCGEKDWRHLPKLVRASTYSHLRRPPSFGEDPLLTFYSDADLKALPTEQDANYVYSFILGWLDADGHTGKHGRTILNTQDQEAADWMLDNGPYYGFHPTGDAGTTAPTNYGPRRAKLRMIPLREEPVTWVVESIEKAGRVKTYCVVEPRTSTFTLAGGVITGNCKAQGGTAVIMKRAMINTRQELLDTPRLRDAKIINQVHDELVLMAPKEVAQEVFELTCKHMEHNEYTALLPVPIIAEGSCAATWGGAH